LKEKIDVTRKGKMRERKQAQGAKELVFGTLGTDWRKVGEKNNQSQETP